MKKSISLVLVLSIIASLFAMCGVTAFAENDIMDYITYEIVDGEVTIMSCEPSISGDIVIPDTIEGYPVTVIGEDVFFGCDQLTAVKLPDKLTRIEWNAFYGCKNLTNIEFPETLTFIGNQSFTDCIRLKSIELPDNVTYIGYESFANCYEIENISLSKQLTYIGSGTFYNCRKITEIFIPEKTETLYVDAFDYCVSLKKINVDENNRFYSSDDGVLFDKEKTILYRFPSAKETVDYTIPSTVKTIYSDAFHLNFNLENIVIPDSVETIGMAAFVHCLKLNELIIPDSVIELNSSEMLYCLSLETLKLGENVEIFYSGNTLLALNMKDMYVYNPEMIFEEQSAGYTFIDSKGPFDEFLYYFGQWMIDAEEYNDEMEKYTTWYDSPKSIEGFTIHGYAGSTAETYANENGFKFVPICRHNYVDTVITPATYTQPGVGGNVCEHCGDVQSTYEIPMLEIEDSEEKIDKDTGVSVVFPEGTFEGEAEIEVKPVEDGEAYKLISHKEGNYKVTMFDINVTVDGQKVQPNGTVLVQIPLPKGYNQNKCVVYYVADDGTMEELKTYHNKDGYVYFETNHFSYYAILEEAETAPENTENDFISYLRSLLNKFINAYLRFLDMIKAVFHMA